MGLGALGLSVAILGIVFAVLLYRGYRMASAYDTWQEMPCTVLSSWVEDVPQPGTTVPWYQFRVRYRYEVGDELRVSDRVTDLDRTTRKRPKAEALQLRYPVGAVTVCYVNTNNDAEAILKRPTKVSGYSIWFPCLFVVGGFGMALVAVRQRRGASQRGFLPWVFGFGWRKK